MKTPIQYCEQQDITHVLMLDGAWHEVVKGSVKTDGPYATWLSADDTGTRITCLGTDVKGVKQVAAA